MFNSGSGVVREDFERNFDHERVIDRRKATQSFQKNALQRSPRVFEAIRAFIPCIIELRV